MNERKNFFGVEFDQEALSIREELINTVTKGEDGTYQLEGGTYRITYDSNGMIKRLTKVGP